jgi:hypothetical protein
VPKQKNGIAQAQALQIMSTSSDEAEQKPESAPAKREARPFLPLLIQEAKPKPSWAKFLIGHLGTMAAWAAVFWYGCQTNILQKTLDGSTDAAAKALIASNKNIFLVRQSIAVAQENADAATDSVKVAKDTAQKQLRAYLGFDEVQIEDHPGIPSNTLHVVIKNYGQTPAHNVTFWAQFKKFPPHLPGDNFELSDDFDYPTAVPSNNASPMGSIYLNPTEKNDSFNSAAPDIDVFNDGYNLLFSTYVYGELSYTDIYNVTHVRPFCFYIFTRPGQPLIMFFTKAHNTEQDVK